MKRRLKFVLAAPLAAMALVLLLSSDTPRLLRISRSIETFANVFRAINEEYAVETDVNALMRVALDSMLEGLDPYTNFFSEAQMEQLRINMSGGWDGIGVEIMKRDGKIVVKEVIEGTPAEGNKIRVGDILLEADGLVLANKEEEAVQNILNGKEGTELRLRLLHPATGEERSLNLFRQKIVKKNVPYYAMLDKETAYIVLTTFTERAAENISNAFKELQENNPKQLILDLRENGGGLLIEAVNICNLFLDKGKEIVSTRNKIPEWDRSFKTLNAPLDTKIPIIVLINGHSASASEIVAGALQDYDRAVLLGSKSFGKGLVQNTRDVGYNSKIKLTTAKYYIPSGRCIQALEYKDGKSTGVADSLKKTFYTTNRRPVPDGEGLYPDFKVEDPEKAAITRHLLEQHRIFDYANYYREKHDSIAPAETFSLKDQDFEDFVAFLKKSNYIYESKTEAQLKTLQEGLKGEPFLASVQPQTQTLLQRLQQIQDKDLYRHKAEILLLLEREIAARYYYDKGRIQITLRNDKDVQQAIALFSDKNAFSNLLKPK